MTANSQALATRSSQLPTQWRMSEEGFSKARALLNVKATITTATALLPASVLAEVIDRLEPDEPVATVNEAVALADVLIGQNPTNSAHNPKVFYNALVALFAAYPRSLGKRAVHKVDGLVANTKFQIKPSDLKTFLDGAKAERDLIVHQARAQLAEHKRRAERDADPIEREAALRAQLTPEQRAERLRMIMAGKRPPPLKGA